MDLKIIQIPRMFKFIFWIEKTVGEKNDVQMISSCLNDH